MTEHKPACDTESHVEQATNCPFEATNGPASRTQTNIEQVLDRVIEVTNELYPERTHEYVGITGSAQYQDLS